MAPPIVLHGISGSGGFWDEAIFYGAIGLLLAGLSAWPFLRRRLERRRGRERRR